MIVKRILIVDRMHECILPLLKEKGFEPEYAPLIDRNEIFPIIHDFEGLIFRNKIHINKELIDVAPKLKFVARAGAGMEMIDYAYLKSENISIFNAPEGNRDALGEHAVSLLLGVLRKISDAYQEIKNGIWDREGNRGIELRDKVVGIYGVGNMGMAFAKKLRGFECELIGYDKYKETFEGNFIRKVSLEQLMQSTEILSIHIPLQAETTELFDITYLRKFQKLKIVINTARGKLHKIADLITLLDEGSLYGVGLDVLENENLASYSESERTQLYQLTSFPNVVVTPHVGGWTSESYKRISEVIAQKIISEIN